MVNKSPGRELTNLVLTRKLRDFFGERGTDSWSCLLSHHGSFGISPLPDEPTQVKSEDQDPEDSVSIHLVRRSIQTD